MVMVKYEPTKREVLRTKLIFLKFSKFQKIYHVLLRFFHEFPLSFNSFIGIFQNKCRAGAYPPKGQFLGPDKVMEKQKWNQKCEKTKNEIEEE